MRFRPRRAAVGLEAEAALADAETLRDAGYEVTWLRQQPATYSASIRHGSEETKLEWVADSDYRFHRTLSIGALVWAMSEE